jgi:ribosomal protein L7/L12
MDNKELQAIKFYFELLINHLNIDINSLLTKEMKKIKENDKIMLALSNGKKIEAIKLYREISSLGLKEAKDTIEYIMKFENIK